MTAARRTRLPLAALPVLLTACAATDIGSVRIEVDEALRGRVTMIGAVHERVAAPDVETDGVTWGSSTAVITTGGTFEQLGDVRVGEIAFAAGTTDGPSWIRVEIPRGPSVRWPGMLTITDPSDRASVRALLEQNKPLEKAARDVGTTVKLELTLPSRVIGSDLERAVRGVRVKQDDNVATLVVPLDLALEPGDPIQWLVTFD